MAAAFSNFRPAQAVASMTTPWYPRPEIRGDGEGGGLLLEADEAVFVPHALFIAERAVCVLVPALYDHVPMT